MKADFNDALTPPIITRAVCLPCNACTATGWNVEAVYVNMTVIHKARYFDETDNLVKFANGTVESIRVAVACVCAQQS